MQDTITFTSAQYTSAQQDNIEVVVSGETMIVPIAPGNRHYDEIMKQVAAGDLTIADAD